MRKGMIFGALVLGSAAVFTNCHRHKTIEERSEWISGKVASKLDLNDVQKKELEKIRVDVVQQFKSEKPQMQQISGEFETMIRSDSIDKAKLKDLQKRRDALHADMENLMIEKVVQLHAVLTPQQRAKAADTIKEFREHFAQ